MVDIDFFGLGKIRTEDLQPPHRGAQQHLLEVLNQPGWTFFITQCGTRSGQLDWDIHVVHADLPQTDQLDHEILNLLEARVYSAQSPHLFAPPRRLTPQELRGLKRWLALSPRQSAQYAKASYQTADAQFSIQTWRLPTGIPEANT